MFVSRSSITNSQSFGNSIFDSIEITNGSIAMNIFDTSANSIFKVNTAGGGTVTVSSLNVTGNFSAGSTPSMTFSDGSAGAPPLNFTSSSTTGMYYTGANPSSEELSFVSNGSDMIKMNDTIGVTILREIKMADTNSTGNIKINGLFDLYSNISIGYTAGNALVLGSAQKNVLIGYKAGLLTTEGDDNIALGSNVMSSGATTGVENICIGKSAGNILTSGINNICIGSSAGNILTEGSNNVLIGQSANPSSGTLSDKLVIRNTNGTLITGDFSSKSLFFDCGTSNIVRTDNTASVTVAGSDYLVRCTYNTGAITVTLPAIVAGEARTVVIVNASASQTVTIVRTGSDTIDDGATTSLVLNNQYDRAVLISNGVASGIWYTI